MFREFKKFALKGNMIDLAVGIIIGGAFNGIVNSLVNDVIMPVFSVLTGKINFSNWFIVLGGGSYKTLAEAEAQGAVVVKYGLFLSGILNFVIMAFVVFLLVRWMNKLKKPGQTEPATKKCPHCFMEINNKASKCPYCTSEIKSGETT